MFGLNLDQAYKYSKRAGLGLGPERMCTWEGRVGLGWISPSSSAQQPVCINVLNVLNSLKTITWLCFWSTYAAKTSVLFSLTVVRSKCSSYVGTTGILVQEFKHVFKIITKENKLKGLTDKHVLLAETWR